jgi:NAD(P)-dependent dehydrogenase (short-subunit alcohol dehydrogenase family)
MPSGRRVIVTRAAGGIGRAIVDALAHSGCRVAACDAPGAPVADVTGAATSATFDVRDRAALQEGVAQTIAALGGCDAVVANAGVADRRRANIGRPALLPRRVVASRWRSGNRSSRSSIGAHKLLSGRERKLHLPLDARRPRDRQRRRRLDRVLQ